MPARRYQITDTGLQQAPLFTHARNHLLRTGLAQITDPDPPAPSRLRTADRAYRSAFNDLARYAHLGRPRIFRIAVIGLDYAASC